MILLGLMFLIVGVLVLTGTYIIYAYVVVDLMNDPLYDVSLMSMIVPSILFLIFLIAIVTVIVKMLKEENWHRLYIISMVYFIIVMSFLYGRMAEPLKDLILFVFFCFIFATILIFIGFKRMVNRRANKDSLP